MASKKHHIYFIKNIIESGPSSDDARLSNSLIAHALNQARSILLKRKLDNYKPISDFNFQTICLTLERTNPTTCALPFALPNECMVSRSTVELPRPLSTRWGTAFEVLFLDGRRMGRLSSSSFKRAKYSLSNLENKASYEIRDNRLYVYGDEVITKIQVRIIAEDPEDAMSVSCDPTDNEYPIDGELVIPMYEMTLQLLGISKQFPEDLFNDASAISQQISTVQERT